MKVSVAQIKPNKGNIQENIKIHKKWIELAISEDTDFIVFPELSLTGYEPELAKELAIEKNDSRLDGFQKLSDMNNITIGLGMPTKSDFGILISMIIFQPGQVRKVYSKQKLHSDETPYFIEGNEQLILTVKDIKIAPAICYESLQKEHSESANKFGMEIYLASVAKSQKGIKKAFIRYPEIATRFSVPVLMSNSIGFCDNFISSGQSAVWNEKGELLERLENDKEGLLIFDTESKKVMKKKKKLLLNFFIDRISPGRKNPNLILRPKRILFNMKIKPIRNEEDYQNALERLEEIFDATKDSEQGDELVILSILIDNYEKENFPIGMPDPIEAIKFRMEQMGMKQKDLAEVIGFKSRVSEILNKKRKLTLEMIRKLNTTLHIPTEVLIQDY